MEADLTYEVSTKPENKVKNRYANILACKYIIIRSKLYQSHFKAGLHLCALRTDFFNQRFHVIGQKKNEALAQFGVTVEQS